jgi:putative transposase
MARLARIVVPECPHHVTARGNRREPIFFEDGDQDIYCDMLAEQARRHGVEVRAYCLMPNHVHLILRPADEEGLGRALGAAHRRWANYVTPAAAGPGTCSMGASPRWPWTTGICSPPCATSA